MDNLESRQVPEQEPLLTEDEVRVNKEKALYNKYIVVRRGKKKYYLVIFN